MHYLLIARFSMDDIPLRLYGNRVMAEEAAKAIHMDPTLLDTKWKRSLDKWPGLPGGFVGAIVLSISELDGYPSKVLFDSTAEAVQPAFEVLSPSGLPDGFVEITDPRHNVRVGIDYYADRSAENVVLWKPVQESSGNLSGFRFCCPADKHPALQSEPAPPDPSGLSRSTDNGPSLASTSRSLDAENADLKRRVAELEAENSIMASKNAELYATNVAYSRTNDELRALNEDLNHRLNATKARAERATDLEGKLRGTAQLLLSHFQRLEERAKWAIRFADDSLMHPNYGKAMLHCQWKFAEEFQGFMHMYPHVLPDIPEEYHPIDDSDDEMND